MQHETIHNLTRKLADCIKPLLMELARTEFRVGRVNASGVNVVSERLFPSHAY